MVKFIILAAGPGKRLYPLTVNRPKCLLDLGGATILQHQIELIKKYGIQEQQISIITGYKDEVIKKEICGDYHFIYNAKYQSTNNIVSLYIANSWIYDASTVFIINSDTLFGIGILDSILKTELENAVVVDNEKELGEEEMKVKIENGLVRAFGKHLQPETSQGEYIGVAKFSGSGLALLFDTLKELLKDNRVNDWYESAFNKIAKLISIYPIYTGGLPWIEIDTIADYEQAEEVYGQIKKN
jgi:choline kinase